MIVRIHPRLAALAALAALSSAACSAPAGHHAGPAVGPTTTTRPAPPATSTASGASRAPISVGRMNTQFGDPASDRNLPVEVLYPAVTPGGAPDKAHGPYPLVVFAEGFDASVSDYEDILDRLASAGYVVAAPTFPDTDPAQGSLDETDIVNHPGDVSTVVSGLKGQAQAGGPLAGLADPSRLGLVGHSDGGDVVLAAAANTCCHLTGVSAVVVWSGALLSDFGGDYFSGPTPPLLVVQGAQDTINPPACAAQIYDDAPDPRFLLTLTDEGHLAPYADPGPAQNAVVATTTAFLNAYLYMQPGALAAMRAAGGQVGTLAADGAAPGVSPDGGCPGSPDG